MIQILATLLLAAQPVRPPAEIAWQASFEATLARAATEKKVVFLAVNMDGEKANERMREKVYADKQIVELSGATLNVVASAAEHAPLDKTCPIFHGIHCLDHRKTDTAARKDLLKADDEGMVVAPQHLWLGPDGKVILSVPYEVTSDELAWCFVTARRKAEPEANVPMPTGARMPKRLVMGGVYDPQVGGGSAMPLTKKEIGERIAELKKGTLRGEERLSAMRRLLSSDDPEVLDFVKAELRSGSGGGGGGGGGGRGGGGGGGMMGRADGGTEKHKVLLHAIGVLSPATYWEIVSEYVGVNEVEVRTEAIVALEQLAAPEATRALQAALAKEEDPAVVKELLRALGTCGANDTKVRGLLTKRAKTDKNELLRLNSILALGSCAGDAEVAGTLEQILNGGSVAERTAAVLAVALTRDEAWIAKIEAVQKTRTEPSFTEAATAALAVLRGAELRTMRKPFASIGQDKVQRERLFGRADR